MSELYQEDRTLVPGSRPPRQPAWNGYVLSGWWRRVGAALIDGFIVASLATLGVILVGKELNDAYFAFDPLGSLAVAAGAALVYYPLLMRATNGRTLGKQVTGIRVVRTDHEPMSLARATWREVVVKTMVLTGVPYLGVLLELIDGLWPLWDRENRAIHDMLAGTRVVRVRLPA